MHKALNGEVWGGVEEGRGEQTKQNSPRNGYANGLGAIRGGGGFLYYFLTQTFFLGGTSLKCPSYHSLVLHPPTPYTLSPLPKGGEGRGEGGSYTHVPCPFGYANGLGAIRGGGGFLGMGFFAFEVERSYVAEHDGLSYTIS